jgi:hypothetical protein
MKSMYKLIVETLFIVVLILMLWNQIETHNQLKTSKEKLDALQKQADAVDKFLNSNYIIETGK